MMLWLSILIGAVIALALYWRFRPAAMARLLIALERRRSGLRSGRLQVGDIDWHYLTGGRGEPLVLLHGFNGDADHFVRATRFLRRHFRILAPDIPGFGETGVEGDISYRIEDQAGRVLALLDELGIQHFYLGGNSMGGYLAVAVARRAPQRVRALWLMAPGGLESAPYSPLFEEIAAGRHNPLIVRDLSDFDRLMAFCVVRPVFVPKSIKRFLTTRAAANIQRIDRIFHAMRFESVPLERLAEGLDIPALIVWGEGDQVLHPDGAEILEARMPNARTVMMKRTGHLPMLERPRQGAETWLAFTESAASDNY